MHHVVIVLIAHIARSNPTQLGSSRMWCLRMWCFIIIGFTLSYTVLIFYLLWGHRTIIIKHHILEHHIPELPNNTYLLTTPKSASPVLLCRLCFAFFRVLATRSTTNIFRFTIAMRCPHALPKIRRPRVFQVFSVPGTERLQKLLSVGPAANMFSTNCSKSNDDS